MNTPRLLKRPLGQILVDGGFISRKDLEHALRKQRRTNRLLGETLVGMGLINPAELNAALSVQRDLASPKDALKAASGTRQLLGDILLQAKRINSRQIEQALKEQEETGEKFGQVLVRKGWLSEGELNSALAFQRSQEAREPTSPRFRLGEILVSANIITREQLEESLKRQGKSGRNIEEVLVESGYVKPDHVDFGLTLQRKLVTAALAAAISLSSVPPVQPREAAAAGMLSKKQTSVSATVRPYVIMKVLYQAPEIVITSAAIQRGYVDAPLATHIDVQSSTPYMLAFEGLGNPFKEVHITGLIGKGEIVISNGSGLVEQPAAGPGSGRVELSYRFVLAEDARPGTYAWPLTMSYTQM